MLWAVTCRQQHFQMAVQLLPIQPATLGSCVCTVHIHSERVWVEKLFHLLSLSMCVVVFYFIFVEFPSDSLFLQVLSAFKMWTTQNICTHITMNRACLCKEVRTLMDILLDAMCFCRTCNAFNMLEIVFDRKQYETDGFGTVHTTAHSTTTSPTTATSIAEYTMNIEHRTLKNDGHNFKSLPHHQFQKVCLYMFRMQRISYRKKKDLKQLHAWSVWEFCKSRPISNDSILCEWIVWVSFWNLGK